MKERFICPKCGHVFEQGECNYNYDTALLDFSCPECDWEGTEKQVIDADDFERGFSLQFNNNINNMEFDKEIDILAIKAYDLNIDDKEDEEVLDAAYGDCEYGIVASRYDENIDCAILGVRYNKDSHIIEAFMKDFSNGIINEWVSINYLSTDAMRSVYVTILEYIDASKALYSL